MRFIAALLAATFFYSATVAADCQCLCIEGEIKAVCDNIHQPRPMCAPTLCAPPPSVRQPKPRVANPGMEWLYASPPNTELGDDSYLWEEFGESAEDN